MPMSDISPELYGSEWWESPTGILERVLEFLSQNLILLSHFADVLTFVTLLQVSRTVVHAQLDDLPGSTAPLKNFDPLGLANVGSPETFNWFQAAELKHGRVAMLASTGFLVQAAGIHFPGMLSRDISFESLAGLNPVEQWQMVPDEGEW